jgi:hypothetical protein
VAKQKCTNRPRPIAGFHVFEDNLGLPSHNHPVARGQKTLGFYH